MWSFVACAVGLLIVASLLVWQWAARNYNSASLQSLLTKSSADALMTSDEPSSRTRSEAVFVFAHPDDEAMFFTPTLRALAAHSVAFHFLCFTKGNYAGLGETRAREMHQSGAVYGASSVTVVDDRRCHDGPAKWDLAFVTAYLQSYLAERPHITLVFTFDAGGVSGHTNHIDTFSAVKRLATASPFPRVSYFQLRTSPLVLKYSATAELLWWAALLAMTGSPRSAVDTLRFVVPRDELPFSLRGMKAHASQLVWFRYLFVVFSQYGFINEWSAIKAT